MIPIRIFRQRNRGNVQTKLKKITVNADTSPERTSLRDRLDEQPHYGRCKTEDESATRRHLI
jgi:hypothetical protein